MVATSGGKKGGFHSTLDGYHFNNLYSNTCFLQGRDLSPVTDKLWKKFYEKEFGVESLNDTIKRMKQAKLSFLWKQLYEVGFPCLMFVPF